MYTENWISCNFHVPWNLLLLLSTVKKCVLKSVASGKVKRTGNWKFLSSKATPPPWCSARRAAEMQPRHRVMCQVAQTCSQAQSQAGEKTATLLGWSLSTSDPHTVFIVSQGVSFFHKGILPEPKKRSPCSWPSPVISCHSMCHSVSIPPLLYSSLGSTCAPSCALWAWSLPLLLPPNSSHFCVYDMR